MVFFSDDENHQFYRAGNDFYDITPDIDYSLHGNMYSQPGSKQNRIDFIEKRDKIAINWY